MKRNTAFWAERVLEETLLNETVEKGITPDAVQKRYQEMVEELQEDEEDPEEAGPDHGRLWTDTSAELA